MSMQRYACIAEAMHEGKASWAAWGRELTDISFVGAASEFVECYPEDAGVADYLLRKAEFITVLVKNTVTGEIVRVIVEIARCIAVTEAVIDKNFIPPKE